MVPWQKFCIFNIASITFPLKKHFLFLLFVFSFSTAIRATPKAIIKVDVGDTITCPGQEIEFVTTGSTDSLILDWGDGSPLNQWTTNPNGAAHIYNTAGNFILILVAYEGSLTDTARIHVFVIPPATANFTTNVFSICSGKSIVFTNNSTTGPFIRYFWNFGDGDYSFLQNPTHVYNGAGKFIITLEVNNGRPYDQCYALYTDSITITADTNLAHLSIAPGCPCNKINFNSNGTAQKWRWDFGRGDSSLLQNPLYTYAQPGKHIVTLIAYDTISGCNILLKNH